MMADFQGWWEGALSRAASLGRKDYRDHLTSDTWAETRRQVMERANGLCEGCRRKRATQVHHLTYAHVGAELLFELVAVCGDCHRRAEAPGIKGSGQRAPRVAPNVNTDDDEAPPERIHHFTWAQLVAVQPGLATLETELREVAQADDGQRTFCAIDIWYGYHTFAPGGYRARLRELVGNTAVDTGHRQQWVLYTPEAYDVAYHHLYDLLPACRGCVCFPIEERLPDATALAAPPAANAADRRPRRGRFW